MIFHCSALWEPLKYEQSRNKQTAAEGEGTVTVDRVLQSEGSKMFYAVKINVFTALIC